MPRCLENVHKHMQNSGDEPAQFLYRLTGVGDKMEFITILACLPTVLFKSFAHTFPPLLNKQITAVEV